MSAEVNAKSFKTNNNSKYKNKFIRVIVTYELELPKAEVNALEKAPSPHGETNSKILKMFNKNDYYQIDIEYNDEPYYTDGDLE